MRYIPHAILIAVVLLLPLAVSILLALSAFTLYTLYVWYAFQLYAPAIELQLGDAVYLAYRDIIQLLRF